MPESPEVAALVEVLDTALPGHRVAGIDLTEFRAWKSRDAPPASLIGARVTGVRRFGKHVAILSDRGSLVISLGRAGWARWTPAGASGEAPAEDPASAEDPPVIARIDLDDGGVLEITDAGDWLSIGLTVAPEPTEVPAVSKLGPDPLGPAYTFADTERALGARRKQLKSLLQEQESFAGVGNAYSDEILHTARLSPVEHAAALDAAERRRLFSAVRDVLGDAARARRGIPLDQQKAHKTAAMRVHGRTGDACPVCGGEIADVPGSKGGAQYCPTCQTGGVALE